MDAKKAYEAPKAEVIHFEASDVIITSNDVRLPVQSPAPSQSLF